MYKCNQKNKSDALCRGRFITTSIAFPQKDQVYWLLLLLFLERFILANCCCDLLLQWRARQLYLCCFCSQCIFLFPIIIDYHPHYHSPSSLTIDYDWLWLTMIDYDWLWLTMIISIDYSSQSREGSTHDNSLVNPGYLWKIYPMQW